MTNGTKGDERRPKQGAADRLSQLLEPGAAARLRGYMHRLEAASAAPPRRGATQIDWRAFASAAGLSAPLPAAARILLRPEITRLLSISATPKADTPRKRGPKPKPVVEFPEPLEPVVEEPTDLASALTLHARRHGDSLHHLCTAILRPEDRINRTTIFSWARGAKSPSTLAGLEILERIERRYRLRPGYFRALLGRSARAATGHALDGVTPAERRRLAWHLPDDFNRRPRAEQDEILHWVRTVIVSGSTAYRRYQAAATRQRYAVRFRAAGTTRPRSTADPEDGGIVLAPPRLEAEMAALIAFKTATFTTVGLQRNGVWGAETADQKVEHYGLWFGALAASPEGEIKGFGVPAERLSFALMIAPRVWDWYLGWREARRGFFTRWEIDLLAGAAALTRPETGWLRQSSDMAERLEPIAGLLEEADIAAMRGDWHAACDRMHAHARRRIKEIERVVRVHRDPFEAILPVLEASSPVAEYRKITEEILRRIPDERRHPRAAAEAVRAFLMLRIGLHSGLRQKNLRELLFAPRGAAPTAERRLEDLKRGEMRWSARDDGWEILIPAVAFKNATSSFFGSRPFRLVLPDLGSLNEKIEAYARRHRANLLGPAADPGLFFVKTAKRSSTDAAYDQNTFYEAWRLAIQRYGIYNPWTKQGAIEGLLPHGPHNVRDVLATHILKQTGSYEQASYAIQDTPEMVAQHYGRFLPKDKAEIAARILNKVWAAE